MCRSVTVSLFRVVELDWAPLNFLEPDFDLGSAWEVESGLESEVDWLVSESFSTIALVLLD